MKIEEFSPLWRFNFGITKEELACEEKVQAHKVNQIPHLIPTIVRVQRAFSREACGSLTSHTVCSSQRAFSRESNTGATDTGIEGVQAREPWCTGPEVEQTENHDMVTGVGQAWGGRRSSQEYEAQLLERM